MLGLCLASHHSGLIDCVSPDGSNVIQRRIEKNHDFTHFEEASENLRPFLESNISPKLQEIENQLFKKMASAVEINESGKNLDSKDTLSFKYGLLIRYLFSCLLDGDRSNTADFESPHEKKIRNEGKYVNWDLLLQRLNTRINEFERKEEKNSVDEIRNQVSHYCLEFSSHEKGIFQLNVPTGGGKTMASLRFALNHASLHQMDRIFYVVPYTSIIDQNADEVRKILEERDQKGNFLDKVVLEHHSNLTPEEESYRHNLLAQNWDAPIIFTTQVRFLETIFGSGTLYARRMHQLANSVIIFDEIQSLPIRCIQLFNLAVRFLVKSCGCTVVLCTATQPLLDKVSPIERSLPLQPENKIISNEKELYRALKRVEIIDYRKAGGWDEKETARLAVDQMEESGSVLIVVNTKKAAQSIYLELEQISHSTLYHLSTNMCPEHRLNSLKEIKEKLNDPQESVICVSTQLIEAGVDVDFGCVIRYLAGLDSIAQAAGRCNRNGRREDLGKVFVINPANENLDRLEDIRIGAQITERVWDEYNNAPDSFNNDRAGLQAMSQYYRYYFFERSSEMNYPIDKRSILGQEDNLFDLLSTNEKSCKEYLKNMVGKESSIPYFSQAFASAGKCFSVIDQVTRGVVVPYEKEGNELINDLCSSAFLVKPFDLLKKAQHFSVNLYPFEFEEMAKKKAINEIQKGSGVYFLDEQYYHPKFGWSKEIVEQSQTLIL
jgi:CRISPR-associated endonuclease/helicase Cas3